MPAWGHPMSPPSLLFRRPSDNEACNFVVTYGDGSRTAGRVLRDTVSFAAASGPNVSAPILLG